jgi:hypothetical protein
MRTASAIRRSMTRGPRDFWEKKRERLLRWFRWFRWWFGFFFYFSGGSGCFEDLFGDICDGRLI